MFLGPISERIGSPNLSRAVSIPEGDGQSPFGGCLPNDVAIQFGEGVFGVVSVIS